MSYKHAKDIRGVRKMRWDELWHVIYSLSGSDYDETYDRVSKGEAMAVLKKIEERGKKQEKQMKKMWDF